jgi:hypothetical protein
MSSFDLQALSLGEPVISGKGGKSVPASYDGKSVHWFPGPQTVAFEPSAYSGEDVSRVNLVMRASPGAVQALTELDEHLIGLAAANSAKIFGKALDEQEVRLRYNAGLKRSEKYPATWKAKVNLSGRNQLRLWDEHKQPRSQPATWVGCCVRPRVWFRGLWVMSKEFGPLFEVSDLQLDEASVECPF